MGLRDDTENINVIKQNEQNHKQNHKCIYDIKLYEKLKSNWFFKKELCLIHIRHKYCLTVLHYALVQWRN